MCKVEKWKFCSESRGFMEVLGCTGSPFPATVLALSWLLTVGIVLKLWRMLQSLANESCQLPAGYTDKSAVFNQRTFSNACDCRFIESVFSLASFVIHGISYSQTCNKLIS
ncbi:hypothetical protein OD218_005284, partial [Salmonella enterica]|nr:hypothetical protein [Salmonella enterica]EJX3251376.1 hypothetical protein [Salmonella enterica]EJX3462203.1 hypothetical protein [Salmonella enterica]